MDIAVYGVGGFGREVAWLLTEVEQVGECRVVGFVDDYATVGEDNIQGKALYNLDSLKSLYPDARLCISVANPATRAKMVESCKNRFGFASAIAPSVRISDSVQYGTGTIICSGTNITVDISIGDFAHVNLNCTIGHDVKIGNFVTLAPGVHVSGNVHIEDYVSIGTGATIINGSENEPIVVREGTVIGASACVIKSTEQNSLYVGVPAINKLKSK